MLHERHHDALDEARLALGARAVHPQMPGFDAELHELRGELGDAERVVVVVRLAADRPAGKEPVALDFLQLRGVEPALREDLVERVARPRRAGCRHRGVRRGTRGGWRGRTGPRRLRQP